MSLLSKILTAAAVIAISTDPNSIVTADVLPKFETIRITQLPEEDVPGFNRAFQFNGNSDLFALFQLYEENLGTIRIWDVDTGKLKSKTIITDYNDAADGGSGYLNLVFSPNQKKLIISGMVGYPMISWSFEEKDKVKRSCEGYMGGWVLELGDFDDLYTAQTVDNEFSLCKFGLEGEFLNYKDWMPEEWWGRNTQTLHNGKILTLYNYHLASDPPPQPKKKPPAEIMEWVDLWDINFFSAANHLISQLDRKSNVFFLVGVFDKKVTINQWDYASKKMVGQTEFSDIQVDKVYLADNYLLLRNDSQFSLIRRTGEGLQLMWSKNLADIYEGFEQVFPPGTLYRDDYAYFDPYSITFSADEKHIIFWNTQYRSSDENKLFSPVILVDVANGAIKKYPPIALNSAVRVDPQARYFFKDHFGCDTEKTQLYSLTDYSDSVAIEGEVMAMSPDGNVLATCHKNEFSFLINSDSN
ncbi:MAG: hypothetical protein ACPG51_19715 [Thiolinea sp.]